VFTQRLVRRYVFLNEIASKQPERLTMIFMLLATGTETAGFGMWEGMQEELVSMNEGFENKALLFQRPQKQAMYHVV
jgi:hypothetical protein